MQELKTNNGISACNSVTKNLRMYVYRDVYIAKWHVDVHSWILLRKTCILYPTCNENWCCFLSNLTYSDNFSRPHAKKYYLNPNSCSYKTFLTSIREDKFVIIGKTFWLVTPEKVIKKLLMKLFFLTIHNMARFEF